MGTSLTGTKIRDTYDALIKVSDNGALDGTLQVLTDGLGNNSALSLSTAGASVGGTLAVSGATTLSSTLGVTGAATLSSTLAVSGGITGTLSTAAQAVFTGWSSAGANSSSGAIRLGNNSSYQGRIDYAADGDTSFTFENTYSSGIMNFKAGGSERIKIYSGGDISFRDSSANEAFYWDASAASLGIGTSPVSFGSGYPTLDIKGSSGSGIKIGVSSSDEAYFYATSTATYLRTATAKPLILGTFDTERMRIDSSGNIGIGVTPTSTLTVSSDTSNVAQIRVLRSNSITGTYLGLGTIGGSGSIQSVNGSLNLSADPNNTDSGSIIGFNVDGSERMRITSGGNTRVGNTFDDISARGAAFQVAGNESMVVYGYGNGFGVGIYMRPNVSAPSASTQTAMQFLNPDTTTVGSITTNASSTAYNTSSDYRLKEDWVAMEGALDRVDALKPVNFAWKADGSRVDGFLAHELAEVVPEAVTGEKDATEIRSVEVSPAVLDEEGNVITEAVYEDQEFPVYQGIDQSKIVPLLAAGLQEAHALIKELRAELNALKQV